MVTRVVGCKPKADGEMEEEEEEEKEEEEGQRLVKLAKGEGRAKRDRVKTAGGRRRGTEERAERRGERAKRERRGK